MPKTVKPPPPQQSSLMELWGSKTKRPAESGQEESSTESSKSDTSEVTKAIICPWLFLQTINLTGRTNEAHSGTFQAQGVNVHNSRSVINLLFSTLSGLINHG